MVSHLTLAFCYLCVQPCHNDKIIIEKKRESEGEKGGERYTYIEGRQWEGRHRGEM